MAYILPGHTVQDDATDNSPPPRSVSPVDSTRRKYLMEILSRPTPATGSSRVRRFPVGDNFILVPDASVPHRVEDKLVEMQALDADWDGYSAQPISPMACKLARKFIKLLPTTIYDYEIYPEPDGSVGWECHNENGFSLYFSFSPDEEIAYVAVYRKDGREEVHRGRGIILLETLTELLQPFIDELVDPLVAVSIARYS